MALDTSEFQKELDAFDFTLRRKVQVLLLSRLLLAVFFLLLTILLQSRRNADLLAAHLQPLYFFSAILFTFTIVASLSLGRVRNLKRFAGVQIIFDVVAVTVLIFLSGGVDSIFSFLYTPVIICGAVLLKRRGSFWTASICSVCYGTLMDTQFMGWLQPMQVMSGATYLADTASYFHTLLMNISAFFLVAFISGYLAEELEKSGRRIREQQKDLYRLEMLNQNIVQSVNSGLLTVDLHGSIQYSNRHAQEILGLAPDQIMQRQINDLFPEVDKGLMLPERLESPYKHQPPTIRRELHYQRGSDQKLCLGYTVSALQDLSRQCFGWIVNFQDVTALMEMETHVQRMERLALAGKMAAQIAHEIKNPLAAMSGAMQMLQGEVGQDPCQAKLATIVCREIDRINTLVTDFLWLAKSPPKSERVQPISICAMILDTISLMKEQGELSARYAAKTLFAVEPVLNWDPHLFQQILWNLFQNAFEAMPDGGELNVRVSTTNNHAEQANQHAEHIIIAIEDTGTGIPTELREKIFEPFFTTKEKGTGLGLSTVYQLVQSCGGRMEVQSDLNRGTTFSLILPAS